MTTERFAGKTALVTGAGSGIGRAAALAFAREGAAVVAAGRSAEALEQTVRLIADAGGEGLAVAADVSSCADVARLVGTSVRRYGGLDVAVNNAGVFRGGPVADMSEDDWNLQVAVNLTGVFLCMKHEIGHMRGHGGGAIVNTASNLGAHMRLPYLGGYAATKAAVSTLTRAAARECIADGIRINAISPGPMDTPVAAPRRDGGGPYRAPQDRVADRPRRHPRGGGRRDPLARLAAIRVHGRPRPRRRRRRLRLNHRPRRPGGRRRGFRRPRPARGRERGDRHAIMAA
jgi:NAD(P)-dependent dehydrogenase (short-subunit alcohol dehydrogenase family)